MNRDCNGRVGDGIIRLKEPSEARFSGTTNDI